MQELNLIIAVVAKVYDVSVQEIMSPSKSNELIRPRQEVYWLARNLTFLSLTAIGRKIGNRNHTTIMHGVNAIAAAIWRDADYANTLVEIEIMIKHEFKSIKTVKIHHPKSINAAKVARRIRDCKTMVALTSDEIRALADAVLKANGETISTARNPIIHPTPETHKHS